MVAPSVAKQKQQLSKEQKQQLEACERTIREGQDAFLRMALAFHEIYRDQLFRPQFETFADYCRSVWDLDDTMAYRYRRAGEVLIALKGEKVLPANEGQCRELADAPEADRLQIWQRIVAAAEKSGQKVTASLITKAVEKVKKSKPVVAASLAPSAAKATKKVYLVSLKVEKPTINIAKTFGECKEGVYSRKVRSADVGKLLLKFGEWFRKFANEYGLIEFSISVA